MCCQYSGSVLAHYMLSVWNRASSIYVVRVDELARYVCCQSGFALAQYVMSVCMRGTSLCVVSGFALDQDAL